MNQIPNIEEESTDIAIANLVFSGLSIAQMDKIPKWLLANIEKNKTKFKQTLHHQLQKAREEAVDELLTDIDFSYLLKEQERGEFGHVTSELERLAFKYRI